MLYKGIKQDPWIKVKNGRDLHQDLYKVKLGGLEIASKYTNQWRNGDRHSPNECSSYGR